MIDDRKKIINNNLNNLVINDQIIMFRECDKYINATQLCSAGGKKFNDWYRLDSTKELIIELGKNLKESNKSIIDNQIINYKSKIKINKSTKKSNTGNPALDIMSDTGNPASQFIDSKKGNSKNFEQGTWIHPDLAIQLAQWISPKFALQVSQWIRTLFINGKVELSLQLEEKDKKIQILQDLIIKKQKRVEYPESNVIYLITSEDNKKNRIYIVGKAVDFKKRLTTYNKTCEHEVVYYRTCKNREQMELCEKLVLNNLEEYREKANRDRFILPIDYDIKFFTNTIDKCINFFT